MPAAMPTLRKPKENNWRAYKSGIQLASPTNITRLKNDISAKLQAYRARRLMNRLYFSLFNIGDLSVPPIAAPPDRTFECLQRKKDIKVKIIRDTSCCY